jgi:hypothetical protein
MKKLLFILVCFISCNNIQKKSQTEKTVARKIDPILESIIKKYPNYTENTIVREDATKALDKKIDSILNLGYFDDIPLKVFRMGNNPNGQGALIQFHTDNYDYEKPDILSNKFNFDIIGFMDKNLASTLKENGIYYVYGKKLKRLNQQEISVLVNQVYFSPQTEIDKDAIWEVYNFNVGDILMEIDSVKIVK